METRRRIPSRSLDASWATAASAVRPIPMIVTFFNGDSNSSRRSRTRRRRGSCRMSLNLGFETGHDLCARSAETRRRNPTETWHLRSQPPHRRARLHGLTSAWGYSMFALAVVLTLAWTVLGVVAVVALVHRGVTARWQPPAKSLDTKGRHVRHLDTTARCPVLMALGTIERRATVAVADCRSRSGSVRLRTRASDASR